MFTFLAWTIAAGTPACDRPIPVPFVGGAAAAALTREVQVRGVGQVSRDHHSRGRAPTRGNLRPILPAT